MNEIELDSGTGHWPKSQENDGKTYLVTAPENILSIILVDIAAETELGREPPAHT